MKRYSSTFKIWLSITALWLWCLCIGVFPESLSATDAPKILVINSDSSVEKYLEAQDAFKDAIAQPIMEVDLGNKKWDVSDIEDLFYDEDPDIIYTIGTKAYLLANKYASKKNIVFSSVINWRRLPTTKTTYGVSNELHAGMEIMLFRYFFPDIQKIGVIYSKKYTGEWFKNAQKDVKEMGVEIVGHKISKQSQVIPGLKKLLPQVDAYWLISDPDVMSAKEDLLNILAECDVQKIPVLSYHETFATFGAVLTVSVDNPTIGRQAAGIVKEIIAENPIEENVQFPAGTWVALNLKKIKEYQLQYNEDALGSASEIIE